MSSSIRKSIVDSIRLGFSVSTSEAKRAAKPSPYREAEVTAMESYWTVVVPHVAAKFATAWHPTEKEGPFATLTRGAFGTEEEAVEWGRNHLGGTPYSTKLVSPEVKPPSP